MSDPKFHQLDRLADYRDTDRFRGGATPNRIRRRPHAGPHRPRLDQLFSEDGRKHDGEDDAE